jgi:hypothetical protein
MNRIRSSSTALVGTTLLLVSLSGTFDATAASAKAAPTTHIMACSHALSTKPSNYIISCADAGSRWSGVKWSSWSAASAVGHGTFLQNDCTPNCAMGNFIKYTATIHLTKAVIIANYGKLFSEADVNYKVNGKPKSQTLPLIDY